MSYPTSYPIGLATDPTSHESARPVESTASIGDTYVSTCPASTAMGVASDATTCPAGVTMYHAGNTNGTKQANRKGRLQDDGLSQPVAATAGDLARLACLWSEQELCGRRPAKVDPFAWACHEPNLDSFMLFVRLKQLPKVPTFCEAVILQQQVVDEEATAAKSLKALANRLTVQLPTANRAAAYNMFDDAEGGDWQEEPNYWLHIECEPLSQ